MDKKSIGNYLIAHTSIKTCLILVFLWAILALLSLLWGLGALAFGIGGGLALIYFAKLYLSERKRAYTELLRLSELNEKIVFNAPIGLFSYDIPGNLTMINKRYYEIAEMKDIEIGNKINQVNVFEVTKDDAERSILQDIVSNGKEYYLENKKVKLNSGKEKYISLRAVPLYEHKKIIGGLAIIEDVTERKRREEQIRMLSRAVEQSPSMVIITDTNGLIQYVNSRFTQVTGYSLEEVRGKNPLILQSGQQSPEVYKELWQTITSGSEWRGEFHHKKKNGEFYWASASVSPIRNSEGVITNFLALEEDITERKLTEAALREIAQGRSAATGMAFFRSLVLHLAKTLGVEYALIGELTGDAKENIITVAMCVHGKIVENVKYHLAKTPCENIVETSLRCYPHGVRQLFPNDCILVREGIESYCGTPLYDSEGKVLGLLVVMDTKPMRDEYLVKSMLQIFAVRAAAELERKRIEEKMNHMAFHDPLTDLPNRRLFFDRVTQELANTRLNRSKLVVLFLDLDRLKLINDTLGHIVGDRLLRGVGERLRNCVGKGNTVARLGGDEFAVLLPGITDVEAAIAVAREIIDTIKEPWILDGQELYITTSIGISLYPNDGENAEILLKHADTAMYRAKQQGRNNYRLYNPAMEANNFEQLALNNSLSRAAEREELLVFYQPKVNINTGEIIGMEALVRWKHPEQGLVSPDRFIPLAEETGLIVSIGEWVLRTACAQNKAWQEAGFPPMRVAVNTSVCQLQQPNFVETVAWVLRETGLDSQWLELEITESAIMEDLDFMIKVLSELREMGILIAIDDFGTGYSSLNYLKRFPINALKIDRTFIHDLIANPNDAAIASAIIAMAQSLGLEVIAEGVETEEQLNFLQQRQCDKMQGYLFGKPMPAETFETLLKLGRPMTKLKERRASETGLLQARR